MAMTLIGITSSLDNCPGSVDICACFVYGVNLVEILHFHFLTPKVATSPAEKWSRCHLESKKRRMKVKPYNGECLYLSVLFSSGYPPTVSRPPTSNFSSNAYCDLSRSITAFLGYRFSNLENKTF